MQSLNEFAREGASSVLTSLMTIFAATVAVFFVDFEGLKGNKRAQYCLNSYYNYPRSDDQTI